MVAAVLLGMVAVQGMAQVDKPKKDK